MKAGYPGAWLHDIRHGVASALIVTEDDAVTVSKMLGHNSLSFTVDHYVHQTPASVTGVAARVEDKMAAAMGE